MTSERVTNAVDMIRKATKGLGCDDKKLIDVVLNLTNDELSQVDSYYKANFGKSVFDVLESETGGNFGKLLSMAMIPEPSVCAKYIHKALSGLISNDSELIREIMVGRSNADTQAIKQAYKEMFGADLEKKLQNEYKGALRKFFIASIQGARDESGNLHKNVDADVDALYKAGEGKIGTDETEFIHILCTRSEAHLRNVFEAYAKKHGRTMDKVIKKEFSGELETTLRELVRCVYNAPEYFAHLFEDAFSGLLDIDNKKLNRLLIRLRTHPLKDQINRAYMDKHGKTLELKIKEKTSGDYEKLCVGLMQQRGAPQAQTQAQQAPALAPRPSAPQVTPVVAQTAPVQAQPAPQPVPVQQPIPMQQPVVQPMYAQPAPQAYAYAAQPQYPPQQQYPNEAYPVQPQYPNQAYPAQPQYPAQPYPGQQYPPQQPQYGYPAQTYPPQQAYAPVPQQVSPQQSEIKLPFGITITTLGGLAQGGYPGQQGGYPGQQQGNNRGPYYG